MRETKENKESKIIILFKSLKNKINPYKVIAKQKVIPIWFIFCSIVDIILIASCIFCLIASFYFLGCAICCLITELNSQNCFDTYVTWFGVFSSVSYIPLLALIFSEYHAAKVSQDEIERDISNSIKSFKIRELPLGLDAKDSHSLYDALLNNNLIKDYFNATDDLNLLHYSYVIEIQFNSNISEMYNLSVLFTYFQLYNARLEKTEIINIRDLSNIEYYFEELCVGKQKRISGDRHITLCCFDDKASEQSIFIFINCNDENNRSSKMLHEDFKEESNKEENKIRGVMDGFLSDGYDNVSSYKKSFILGLNFYPRQGPRKVYRYRLFPIIRALYNYLYVRMISRRAMQLEFDITETKNYGCFNKFQHDYQINDVSFAHIKNIGEWGVYVRKRNKAIAKNIDDDRKIFINYSINQNIVQEKQETN